MEIWAVFRHIAIFGLFREKTARSVVASGPLSPHSFSLCHS